jgi:hypothetical protein
VTGCPLARDDNVPACCAANLATNAGSPYVQRRGSLPDRVNPAIWWSLLRVSELDPNIATLARTLTLGEVVDQPLDGLDDDWGPVKWMARRIVFAAEPDDTMILHRKQCARRSRSRSLEVFHDRRVGPKHSVQQLNE